METNTRLLFTGIKNIINVNKIYLHLFLLISVSNYSQVNFLSDQAHQKYWYYYSRLNNDFLKVGKNAGESIPINQRGEGFDFYQYFNIPGTGIPQTLKVGDAISGLGVYIGVLATQYALLVQNNQNTDSVRHELFCALNAVNRLDDGFEKLYGNNNFGLNGFLMRDDVPVDFVSNNYKHFNYFNNWDGFSINSDGSPSTISNDRGFASRVPYGQRLISSDFSNNSASITNLEMSQDHVISLLMGLALVTRLVDAGANDNGAVFTHEGLGEIYLRQEAINIANRIGNYLGQSMQEIKNPCTGQSLHIGGDLTATKYGIDEAICHIVGYPSQSSPFVPLLNASSQLYPKSCHYTQNGTDLSRFSIWTGWVNSIAAKADHATFKSYLIATGDCAWRPGYYNQLSEECYNVTNTVCQQLPFPFNQVCSQVSNYFCNYIVLPIPSFNNDPDYLLHNVNVSIDFFQSQRPFEMFHNLLLHKVLHNQPLAKLGTYQTIVEDLLSKAPCEGPFNFGPGYRPDYEWTSDTRLEHPERRFQLNEPDFGYLANGNSASSFSKGETKGEYNGLDYMLMHNLYRLSNPHQYFPVHDLSDRIININIPTTNGVGSNTNPAMFFGFETITADNTILANADVEYRAGKEIILKSGFTASAGSDFHANIQSLSCSNGGTIYSRSNTDSTNEGRKVFNEPTHYVNYPSIVKNNETKPESTANNPTKKDKTPVFISNKKTTPSKIENGAVIYPIPTSGKIHLKYSSGKSQTCQLNIYNTQGELIKTFQVKDDGNIMEEFDLSNLNAGVYFITLIEESGNEFRERIILVN